MNQELKASKEESSQTKTTLEKRMKKMKEEISQEIKELKNKIK